MCTESVSCAVQRRNEDWPSVWLPQPTVKCICNHEYDKRYVQNKFTCSWLHYLGSLSLMPEHIISDLWPGRGTGERFYQSTWAHPNVCVTRTQAVSWAHFSKITNQRLACIFCTTSNMPAHTLTLFPQHQLHVTHPVIPNQVLTESRPCEHYIWCAQNVTANNYVTLLSNVCIFKRSISLDVRTAVRVVGSTTDLKKIAVFWAVTPSSLVDT
jgi:hypothetical protein